ncbi:MAG: SDR family oxidoreductase [Cyanobacteriota bacterium]|nr:SDR family oxidoreductase [Cyanobacteriota bacterium]
MSHTQNGVQKALVTGASRGIGRTVALRLASQGFSVAVVARSAPDLQALVQEIEQMGGTAQAFPVDLSDVERVPSQLDALLKEWGSCDLLINNAGIGYTGTTAATPLTDWQRVFNLNVTAAFLCIQAVLPGMRQRGGGQIINVISIAGKQAFPGWSAYCASKFALLGMTQALAQEERANKIRVTAFCPGSVNTPLWDSPTVQANFDRSQMLTIDQVADSLLHLVLMSPGAVVEEMVLMPAGGVF